MKRAREIAEIALRAGEEAKTNEPVLLDLEGLTLVADFFLILEGRSKNHVQAIARDIEEKLADRGFELLHREGLSEGRWVLLDYSDVIIHIFHPETRQYYDLERLWGDARRVNAEST